MDKVKNYTIRVDKEDFEWIEKESDHRPLKYTIKKLVEFYIKNKKV